MASSAAKKEGKWVGAVPDIVLHLSSLMIKYFLLVIVLTSCANNDSVTPKTKKKLVADSVQVKVMKDNAVSKTVKLFDNQKPFKVISAGNRIERNTTDEDTIKCNPGP